MGVKRGRERQGRRGGGGTHVGRAGRPVASAAAADALGSLSGSTMCTLRFAVGAGSPPCAMAASGPCGDDHFDLQD